jgi:farnesyl-diphosphate farnesyltransferase
VRPGATSLLTELLKAVSRSFYLTMRVLPAKIRPQFGLAYLLARAADTIADTEIIPVTQRLEALRDLRERILGTRPQPLDFRELARSQGAQRKVLQHCEAAVHDIELSKIIEPSQSTDASNAERRLLEQIEDVLGLVSCFAAEDQQRIREVLTIITGGQELDLRRFASVEIENRNIVALKTDAELDDYTYRVAGCVGEFWTKMCRAHVFSHAKLDDDALLRDGVRFGKGLQLVNILRDLPRDLQQGRCYLPIERLTRADLKPKDLLDRSNEARLRPVYDDLLNLAESHLAAGWAYTNSLPRSAMRIRLACAWPVLIGVKTLARLRRENPLDAEHRVKVSRAEVKQIMVATLLRYPFAASWQQQFERFKS